MPSLADLYVTARLSDRDVAKSAKTIRSTLTRLDGTKVEPTVDLPDLGPQVKAMQGKLQALSRTQIRLNVDSALAGTEVTTLRKQLDDLKRRRVEVPVGLTGRVDAEIAQVARELEKAERRETTLPLKLERVDARVAAVKAQLATLERDTVDIPVDVDQRGTLRQRVAAVRQTVSEGLQAGMARSGEDSGSKFTRGLSSVLRPGVSALAAGVAGTLATVGVSQFLDQSKQAASDLKETVSQSGVVFGESAGDIQAWSRTAATSLGLSRQQALAAATSYGDMFTQLGFTEKQSAATSREVVQLASDLGSFKNVEPTDVLDRISGALRGEYDSLQALIPNINAARVEQEALTQTGKKAASALTAQEKATATLAIIQRDGAKAQGDFARTAGDNANQQRILDAQLADVQARLGEQVIPLFLSGTKAANQFLTEMQTGQGTGGDFVEFLKGAGQAGQDVLDVLRPLGSFLGSTFFASADSARVAIAGLATVMVARKAQDFAAGLASVSAQGSKIGTVAGGLSRTASFLGGPWGIAVGVGVTALTALITKETQAAKEAQAFTDSLTYQKGALDGASQAAIAKKLADEGALDTARAAGVAETAYVKALVAGGPARDQMIAQLRRMAEAETSYDAQGAVVGLTAQGQAAGTAADKLQSLGSALDTSARNSQVATTVTKALGDAQRSTGGQTQALSELQGQLRTKTAELKSKTDALIASYTILRGGTVSTEEATLNFESALDRVAEATGAATKASNDNSGSLKVGSDRGRQNREAVLGMVRALNDDVTATFKAKAEKGKFSEAQRDASDKLRTGKERLLDSAEAAGLNRGEVRRMIDQMLKTPKELETDVDAPGLDRTRTDVKDLDKRINDLNNKSVTVDTKIKFSPDKLAKSMIKGDYFNNPGAFQARAAGGPIQNLSGRGVKGRDTEHILGAVGEHMLTSREVDAVGGHGAVHQIRKGMLSGDLAGYTAGQLRPMADGGAVERLIRTRSTIDRIPRRAVAELMPGLARLSGAAGLAYAEDVGTKWARAAKAKYDKEMSGSGGGPVGGGSYAGALKWARSQDPKPYGWATSGPGSYDCCIIGGVRVYGPDGARPIADLRAGDRVYSYVDGRVETHTVTAQWKSLTQQVFAVRTRNRTVTASANHPFMRLVRVGQSRHVRGGRRGEQTGGRYDVQWAHLDELRRGDLLVQPRSLAGDPKPDPSLRDGTPVDADVAWLIGAAVGDGTVTATSLRLCLFGEKRDRATAIIRGRWGCKASPHPTAGIIASSVALASSLTDLGMMALGPDKRIPEAVWHWPAALQRAFLAGYCDADGYRPTDPTKHGDRTYHSASRDLVEDVRAMHIMLGDPVSNISTTLRKPGHAIKGKVIVNARPLHSFTLWAGKGRGEAAMRGDRGMKTWLDAGEFTLTRVLEIRDEGVQDTYDIEVEGAHNFVADGVVVHNSGFMSAIANYIQGRPLYGRRFSTPQAGGRTLGGFTRNKVSPFRIGVVKGSPGHTAGTLNGVNVESRGGDGVVIGPRARGWNDRLFSMAYGLAAGGPVVKGDPPFDTLDGRGKHFDQALAELLDAPELASGALVKGGRGGVLARIGEGSSDELVAPLPQGWSGIRSAGAAEARRPIDLNLTLDLGDGITQRMRLFVDEEDGHNVTIGRMHR